MGKSDVPDSASVKSDKSFKTLFVTNLPPETSNNDLDSVFGDIGPLRQSFCVKERGKDRCKGFGYVTFVTREDAEKAIKEVKDMKGKKVNITFAAKKPSLKERKTAPKEAGKDAGDETEISQRKGVRFTKGTPSKKKKGRLFIRNVSFKCSEDDLKKEFSTFGGVGEVQIPKDGRGKKRGFAMVQFDKYLDAAKALKELNGKLIKGREVAVQWAVPKEQYVQQGNTAASSQPGHGKGKKKQQQQNAGKVSGNAADGSDDDAGSDGDAASDDDAQTDTSAGSSSEDEGSDAHDEDDEEEEEEEMDVSEAEEDEDGESEDEDDDDFEDNDDGSEDDELISDEEMQKVKRDRPSDVTHGRTIFLRNVSYDTEEENLSDLLSQFGKLKYCKLVLDPVTEHPKGTAFVQYVSKAGVDQCLEAAAEPSRASELTLDGRLLCASLAVDRSQAQEFSQKGKKPEKVDKRNLWLASEGLIRPGTKAAEGLSEVDLRKRQRIELTKRTKLKDQNVFISPTRLCVHNIPKRVDDQELRKIALRAARDKRAKITECRVMRDMKNVSAEGVAKSLGFAFVNFSDHQHALTAVRALNNSADTWGKDKRPIVEFSLENKLKLLARQRRIERSKLKAGGEGGGTRVLKLGVAHPSPVPHADGTPARKGLPKLKTRPRWKDAEAKDAEMKSNKKARKRGPDEEKESKEPQRKRERQASAAAGGSRKERRRGEGQGSEGQRSDKFESLVSQYKQKLFGSSANRGDWLNS